MTLIAIVLATLAAGLGSVWIAAALMRSGIGRESGQEAMDEYLQTKSVWIDLGLPVSNPFVIR